MHADFLKDGWHSVHTESNNGVASATVSDVNEDSKKICKKKDQM